MPRVAPITGKSDVPAEHHAVVDGVLKTFGQVRGPFSMLLHSPELAERILSIVNFYRDSSVVEQKLRSLAILVAVREREAAYVWAAQVAAAKRAGVREEVIDALQKRYGTKWLVELTAAANYFGLLCGIVNAFEVPAAPDGDKISR